MNTDSAAAFDLAAYLARTGYAGDLAPTRATLEGLHLAHATRVPFENLDVLLGRPIRLDLDSLQAKLVRDRRGGYRGAGLDDRRHVVEHPERRLGLPRRRDLPGHRHLLGCGLPGTRRYQQRRY